MPVGLKHYISFSRASMILSVLVFLVMSAVTPAGDWQPLMNDSLHDPENPALQYLQNPGDALGRLPGDNAGNKVDWIRSLENGYIRPRSELRQDTPVRILETDILMNETGSIPRVLFPHKAHTQWLDCDNCHEGIFKSQAGATPITMGKILEGEYCGVCHGAVAFPLTECSRCHSVPWQSAGSTAAEKR